MFNPFVEILLNKEINNIKMEEENQNQNNQNITQDNKDKQDSNTNIAENKDQENKDKIQNDNKESENKENKNNDKNNDANLKEFKILDKSIPENVSNPKLNKKIANLIINYLKDLYQEKNYEEVENVEIIIYGNKSELSTTVNTKLHLPNFIKQSNYKIIAIIKANLKLPKYLAIYDKISIYLNGELIDAINLDFNYFKHQLETAKQPEIIINLSNQDNNKQNNNQDNNNQNNNKQNNNQDNNNQNNSNQNNNTNNDQYKFSASIIEQLQAINDVRNKKIEVKIVATDESGKVQSETTTLISKYPQEVIDNNFESLNIQIVINNEILGNIINGNLNYKLLAKEINKRIKKSDSVIIRANEIPKRSRTVDIIMKVIAIIITIGFLWIIAPVLGHILIHDIIPFIGIALVIGGLVVYYFKRKGLFGNDASDNNNNNNNYNRYNNRYNNNNNSSEQFNEFIKKAEKFIALEDTMQIFTPESLNTNNIKTEDFVNGFNNFIINSVKSINDWDTAVKQFSTAYANYKVVKDPAQYVQYLHATNNLPHVIGLGALTVILLYLAGIAASMYGGASFSHVIAPLSILALSGFASLYAYFAQMQHLPLNSSQTLHMFINTAKSNISSIMHISPVFTVIAAILTGAIVFKILSFISTKLQNPPKANPSVLSESNLNNNLNTIKKQVL